MGIIAGDRPMKLAVPRESTPGERRVAIVADSVKRLAEKKIAVTIEAGAGLGAQLRDDDYLAVGAQVEASRPALLQAADVVVFHPGEVADRATYDAPCQPAAGIHSVLVNGRVAWQQGRHTGARTGQVLARTAPP